MDQDSFNVIQIITNLLTAGLAAFIAWRIYMGQRNDSKRQFCFELQRQFDTPEMFKCRYQAWKLLHAGALQEIKTTDQLVAHASYGDHLSVVLHFFERLDHYIEEGLVDKALAKKLFERSYDIWYPGLLKDMAPSTHPNLIRWMGSIKGLHEKWT